MGFVLFHMNALYIRLFLGGSFFFLRGVKNGEQPARGGKWNVSQIMKCGKVLSVRNTVHLYFSGGLEGKIFFVGGNLNFLVRINLLSVFLLKENVHFKPPLSCTCPVKFSCSSCFIRDKLRMGLDTHLQLKLAEIGETEEQRG